MPAVPFWASLKLVAKDVFINMTKTFIFILYYFYQVK